MSMITAAPPAKVWTLIKAGERFPSFMDEVLTVEIIAQADGTRTSSWAVRLEGAVLEWTQSETIDDVNHLLTFRQIDGDLAALSGVWQVTGEPGGATQVVIEVSFDIGIPLLADILNPPAIRALRDNFQRLLDKIEAHVDHVETATARHDGVQ